MVLKYNWCKKTEEDRLIIKYVKEGYISQQTYLIMEK